MESAIEPRLAASPEGWVMLCPGTAYRCLAQQPASGGLWLALRRPLLFTLFLGCIISLVASERVTLRLVAGEALAWSIVPALEIASLAAVCWRRRGTIGFARALDLFFTGHGPWLLWMLGFATLRCLVTAQQASAWTGPPLAWWFLLSTVPIVLWSLYIDWSFFREVLQEPAGRAAGALLLQRAIAWGCGAAYFAGFALWPLILERLRP